MAAADGAAPAGATPPPRGDAPAPLPPSERLLVVTAALLPLVFSTEVYGAFWSPKAALLLPLLVPGLAALAGAARRGVPGARPAAAFVVAAGISTVLADRPLLALVGLHGAGTGWLFVATLAGLFALGAGMSEAGRRALGAALLAGAVVNGVVGWVQASVDLPVRLLDPADGRSTGLLGNSVHLGGLTAAGLWLLVAGRAGHERTGRAAVAAAVLAGAVQLSGSRAALLVTGVGLLVGLVRRGPRRGAVLVGAATLGVVAATLLPPPETGAQAATTRISPVEVQSGWVQRRAMWEAGLGAVRERPLVGFGPARFRAATAGRVRVGAIPNQGELTYADAHNFALEYAVTTGLLGLGLLGAWLVGAGRRARGPLAAFAAAGTAVSLLQPLSVGVSPLLALALGAGVRAAPLSRGRLLGRGARAVAACGALGGLVVAGVLLAGEVALARAALDFSRPQLARAERLLPAWPQLAEVAWRIEAFDAIRGREPGRWEAVRARAEELVRRDPSSAAAWNDLADTSVRAGDPAGAAAAYREALRRHPSSRRALLGLVFLAARKGDAHEVARLCARLAVVDPRGRCPETSLRLYAGVTVLP